ncbi:MAG: glycosyltransferase, partial [Opitutus sp.]
MVLPSGRLPILTSFPMRVCHIVPSLEERHGGPSKSVRALANAEAALGAQVELLATLEPGQTVAAGADRATVRTFPRVTPRWLSRSPELRRHLQATPADVVHHHSLWLLTLRYAAEAARRRDVPLVISPRGMMSGWAWQHRRWRKKLAEWLVHPGVFAQTDGWHATSPE